LLPRRLHALPQQGVRLLESGPQPGAVSRLLHGEQRRYVRLGQAQQVHQGLRWARPKQRVRQVVRAFEHPVRFLEQDKVRHPPLKQPPSGQRRRRLLQFRQPRCKEFGDGDVLRHGFEHHVLRRARLRLRLGFPRSGNLPKPLVHAGEGVEDVLIRAGVAVAERLDDAVPPGRQLRTSRPQRVVASLDLAQPCNSRVECAATTRHPRLQIGPVAAVGALEVVEVARLVVGVDVNQGRPVRLIEGEAGGDHPLLRGEHPGRTAPQVHRDGS